MSKIKGPVVIGVDPHKRINAVVAIDGSGVVLGRGTFANSTVGLRELAVFARRFPSRTWAVEGCNGVGKHLSQRLVAGGERVLDVATRRSSLVRVFAGGNGRKSDDTDALSIATVGLQSTDLPVVCPDDRATTLRLLAHRRAELVSTRTQAVCRLQRELLILIPGGTNRGLTAPRAKTLLASVRPRDEVGKTRKAIALDLLADLVSADKKIKAITDQIKTVLADTDTTLTDLFGVGAVSAAALIGEVLDVARFVDADHFASYNGTAPIEWGSGNPGAGPFILNRGGNRRINHAVHMVAVCQIRHPGPGRDYYLRKIAEGKTKKEALRCLKRRISDAVYRRLVADARHSEQRDPGGHSGTTHNTSATGSTPTAGSSVKPQPGPHEHATPAAAKAS
jgi:transposase